MCTNILNRGYVKYKVRIRVIGIRSHFDTHEKYVTIFVHFMFELCFFSVFMCGSILPACYTVDYFLFEFVLLFGRFVLYFELQLFVSLCRFKFSFNDVHIVVLSQDITAFSTC